VLGEGVLLDEHARPDRPEERLLGHDPAARGDQDTQELDGLGRELHRLVLSAEQPLVHVEAEGTELEDAAGRPGLRVHKSVRKRSPGVQDFPSLGSQNALRKQRKK